jgi:Flp pilus assembly pilin Flp
VMGGNAALLSTLPPGAPLFHRITLALRACIGPRPVNAYQESYRGSGRDASLADPLYRARNLTSGRNMLLFKYRAPFGEVLGSVLPGGATMNTRSAVGNSKSRREKTAWRWLQKSVADQSGVASPEYAVMLALICAVSIGAVSALGNSTKAVFGQIFEAAQGSPEPMPAPACLPSPPPPPPEPDPPMMVLPE